MSENTTNKIGLINLPDLPESVDNAAKNLTDVPTKNAGQTFGDIWYLVFGGISHAADKKRMKYAADLEQYRKELTQSIEQIPEDKKVEPSIQVTAQALENSKYCVSSEELRQMFVSLISNTMNKDFSNDTHPSFPEILKQMSPLDAKLLKDFKGSPSRPIVNYIVKNQHGSSRTFMQYVYIDSAANERIDYSSSVSSLQRLGLISVRFDEWFADEGQYERFKNSMPFQLFISTLKLQDTAVTPDIKKGLCRLTPLGEKFIKVCIP